MQILLDTCSFLWLTLDSPELSETARNTFLDEQNEIFLSAISAWEIAIKASIGRLSLPTRAEEFVPFQRESHGIIELGLSEETALSVYKLPHLHKDPFDRMLISESIQSGMILLTPDPLIKQYNVRTLW